MINGYGGFKGIQRVGFLTTTTTRTTTSSSRGIRFPTRCISGLNDYAVLGLSPFASKADVKFAYKRLALKYHPDVIKGELHVTEKKEMFREIISAYESLMQKFEEEEQMQLAIQDEFEEWDEWMGFEGGLPATYQSC